MIEICREQQCYLFQILSHMLHFSLSGDFFFYKNWNPDTRTFYQSVNKNKHWYQEEESKKKIFLLCTLTSLDEIYKDDKKKILYGFIIRIKILLLHSFWIFQNTLQNFSTLSCRYMSLHVVCNGKRMYLNTFIINI